jgi:hypothetical protein
MKRKSLSLKKPLVRASMLSLTILALIIGTVALVFDSKDTYASITTRTGSAATAISGSSVTVAKPSGAVAGDLLIVYLEYNATTVTFNCSSGNAPAGSGVVATEANGYSFTNEYSSHVYSRVVTAGDPSSYTFSFTGSCRVLPYGYETVSASAKGVAGISAYGGANGVGAILGSSATSTSITAPSITTTYANSKVITLYGIEYGTTITLPGGVTSLYNLSSSGGSASSKTTIAAGEFTQFSQSATGDYIATAATSAMNQGVLVELIDSASLTPAIDQASYAWFANADSTSPGSALASQNTATSLAAQTPFRLRQRLGVSAKQLDQSAGAFKLQYAEKSGTCDTSFSGETYADIPLGARSVMKSNTTLARSGTSTTFLNPGYAVGSDNTYATDTLPASTSATDYLYIENTNWNIPSNATITGVRVGFEGSWANLGGTPNSVSFGLSDLDVRLTSLEDVSPNGSESIRYAGGPTDMLGTSLTPSDINNSTGFGAYVKFYKKNTTATSSTINVDDLFVEVYYTTPDTGDAIFFNANGSVTDNATISSATGDPTGGARPTVYQSYQDANPFTNNTAAIPSGSDGMWDFSLDSRASAGGKTYCVRTVHSDGSLLDSYSYIPEISFTSTGPTLEQMTRGGRALVGGVETPFNW